MSDFHFFLRPNNIPLYVYFTFCLFIHLSVDPGLLPPLVIVNTATMNICVKIYIQVPAFSSFGCMSRNCITRSYGNSMFNLGTTILFSTIIHVLFSPLAALQRTCLSYFSLFCSNQAFCHFSLMPCYYLCGDQM